jgi:sugar lactone lactonase YvrE
MLAGDILSFHARGSVTRRHVAAIVAAVRPRQRGGAVLGIDRGFALEEPDGTLAPLPPLWDDARVRMNEGACDPDGRFYCGSMAEDGEQPRGTVHRLDPDGTVHPVLDGVTISNGLDWSPDGTRAYYVDTPTKRIDVFDYDPDAGLTARRPFVDTDESAGGQPDGLTVDAEGGVWVAMFGGSAVRRYAADGVLDVVVEIPARQVTACTFGGPDLDDLYVTTSRQGLPEGDDPTAGSLFRVEVGVRGVPTKPFAG